MSFFGNIEGSVWYRSPNRHSNEGILFWNEPTTWIQMTQILLQTQIYNYYVSRLEPDLVCQKVSILDISWYVIWIHLDIFSKPCLFFSAHQNTTTMARQAADFAPGPFRRLRHLNADLQVHHAVVQRRRGRKLQGLQSASEAWHSKISEVQVPSGDVKIAKMAQSK